MSNNPMPPSWVIEAVKGGLAIPAHPLALTAERRLDEERQAGLSRYYHSAGAGGVAVAVHTTQFAIRSPDHALFKPVLELAAETMRECDSRSGRRTILVSGVCGGTDQAISEGRLATDLGFHAGLLSLAALGAADDDTLIDHSTRVGETIPLIGFYLQQAVGGRRLSVDFWRRFAQIPNVVAIKIAPFNRYATLDVIRGVIESGRAGDIALYTGNDDSIIVDLLTEYKVSDDTELRSLRIVGGLLGHWACWTRRAVEQFNWCREIRSSGEIPSSALTLAAKITDCNAAFFDAANNFAGCIAGIHEVLRRQGLLANNYCLDPHETLSPGQFEEIDRVYRAYPELAE